MLSWFKGNVVHRLVTVLIHRLINAVEELTESPDLDGRYNLLYQPKGLV
jgi:hypothetical protein